MTSDIDLAELLGGDKWMSAEDCYQEGLKAAAAEQNGAAGVSSFQMAHALEPNNLLYAMESALALNQAGDNAQALVAAREGLENLQAGEVDAYTLHRIALVFSFVLAQGEMALTFFRQAFEKNPDEPELRVAYALSLAESGEKMEAAALVEAQASDWVGHGVSLDAKQARLLSQMAHLFSGVDSPQAAACIRKAQDAATHQPEIHRIAGVLALRSGDHEESVTQFRKAIDLAPGYDRAWSGLQAAMLGRGWHEEAVDLGRKILKTWPEFSEVRFNLAAACLNLGWHQEADDELWAYLGQAGEDALAHACLGLSYAMQGRTRDARKEQARALELDGDDVEVARVSADIDRILGGGGDGQLPEKVMAMVLMALLARHQQEESRSPTRRTNLGRAAAARAIRVPARISPACRVKGLSFSIA